MNKTQLHKEIKLTSDQERVLNIMIKLNKNFRSPFTFKELENRKEFSLFFGENERIFIALADLIGKN